jgi:5-methylcytosine-specific restriction endonuclease McrA
MAATKVCYKCKIEKDVTEFYRNKSKKDGLSSSCKQCDLNLKKDYYKRKRQQKLAKALGYRKEKRAELNERAKQYYQENKDKIKLKRKIFREKNRELIGQGRKENYKENKEEIIKKQKQYYRKYKDAINMRRKIYREENKEIIQIQRREKYKRNKKQIKAKAREYYRNNIGKIKIRQKKYRKKYAEQLKQYNIEYRNKHKAQIREKQIKWRQAKALYGTYAKQLTIDESPMIDENGFMLVKCTYCGRYFYPSNLEAQNRILAIEGKSEGEQRLYCSDNCKLACPVFKQQVWPKDQKPATSREVQPELRQMRLACDEYSCQMCGKTIDDAQLHCHHIEGTVNNPIESADLDNTITLCKKCHKWAHTQEGCRYFELRCE